MVRTMFCAAAAIGLVAAAPASPDWRQLDLENTLVIETTKGRVVVELRPEFAPKGVERVKRLAREHVYDGLQFHRVIGGFVAQTGNPNNKDGGTSAYPDLPPEFSFRIAPDIAALVVDRSDAREGFVGAVPIVAVSKAEQGLSSDLRIRAWGAYCPGVVGLGRQADPGTANSEIFFMRASARRLDHDYAVIGRAIAGLEVIRKVAVGEAPAVPDLMLKVRVAADLPASEQPRLEIMDTRGSAFRVLATSAQTKLGAQFSVCDLAVPTRAIGAR